MQQSMNDVHSSEIRGLCLMKQPSKMLQKSYVWNTKTHVFFYFTFRATTLFFPQMNALVYDQGIH